MRLSLWLSSFLWFLPELSLHSLLQERQDGRFFGRQFGQRRPQLSFGATFEQLNKRTVLVRLENGRVDVARAANGGRVPQPLGDALDGPLDISLSTGLGIEIFELLQCLSC